MTISPGTFLGRYEIRSKIGSGGMGEVYLAQDTKLDRKVALKALPVDVAANQDRMRRFVQEAKAASALNHPNIITIYEIEEIDSVNFIATEFIDGETLRERMLGTPMTLGQVLDVSVQVANALAAAHAAGIVHRDIKPDNIMLRRDAIVKVLDFGLAKLTERTLPDLVDPEAPTRPAIKTEPGAVMGTVLYMSPEQARGLPVDARTDIFSLGVVIYEMIAGRLPFEGSNTNEILSSILSDKETPPLARYTREIPTELDRIVAKALRKYKAERYQTIQDMLLDLKSLNQEMEFERRLKHSERRAEAGAATSEVAETAVRFSPSRGSASGEFPSSSSLRTAPVSSLEYMISGIKQHKLGAALALLVVLVATGIAYWGLAYRASRVTTIDSIAVMPFENVKHDQTTEYLSDGVTESLINSLSQLPRIKVIARNSVFRYKNQTLDLQQVARQLDVHAVLTGRVIEQDGALSVSVELTDTQNNAQLWGQRYTRKAADIFAVQDEIARQVTDALRVRLNGGQQDQVTKRYTENAEAYRCYLQGRYYFNEGSEENSDRALSSFDQAIALDPRYALAYAARGETFFNLGDITLSMSEAIAKAKNDATAALSIDDKLADARMILANIRFQYDWDFAGAEDDFKQVIASSPNYAEAHHQYAYYLALTGRPMEGVAEMKLAQQLDPVNPSINVDVNLPYYLARQYDQSIAQARLALEMFPNFFLSHMALGAALFEKGDTSAGLEELEKAKAMEPAPLVFGNLGYAYAKSGRKGEARRLLAELKEQSKGRYVAAYWIAVIHASLNEKDEAFAWLQKAYQDRGWWLIWAKMDPKVDSLRSDPRFIDLMRRIGFPQ